MTLRLDDLGDLDLSALQATGLPMMLAVDAIDEDPEQPRREFDANALNELAETIRERGVRQPVSVRPDLQRSGRWMLNFGARRLRAARLAGLNEIPAFVDATADSYDQVIENEQRVGLRPLELALFVQKRLARGDNQSEIARRLGKSRQWVTLATALIDAPQGLLDAYRQRRCNGMNELYEVRRLHGEQPERVEAWLQDVPLVTRERLAELRSLLAKAPAGRTGDDALPEDGTHTSGASRQGTGKTRQNEPDETEPTSSARPHRQTNMRIHVELDGHDYQLVVSVPPPEPGTMYVRPIAGGPRRLAKASDLQLRGFVDT